MELDALQARLGQLLQQVWHNFQRVPGSAMLVRYIQSSYQNDPVRSAIELILVLFFIRYLLSPSYSTHKQNYVKLREDVCGWPSTCLSATRRVALLTEAASQEIDELVHDWAPEPLVAERTVLEEYEGDKVPVIVG